MNAFPSFRLWLGWTWVHGLAMGGIHALLAFDNHRYSVAGSAYASVLALSLAQPFFLRGRGRWLWAWPGFTLLGAAASFVATWYATIALGGFVCLLQWPLLASCGMRRTFFWPLMGQIGWFAGLLIGWFAAAELFVDRLDFAPGYWQACFGLTVLGLCYGAVTGCALALMQPAPTACTGWLYYDGACPFCLRWLGRLGFIARQGGFEVVQPQSEAARRDLGLSEGELPAEMKLRLADGRLLGGVDAYIVLAEAAGWTAPLGWLARVPGFNQLAWRGYRWIAANRYCLGASCQLPAQPERRLP